MPIKRLLKFAIPAILIGLFAFSVSYADNSNFWLISGSYLKPLFSSYGLQLPTLPSQNCLGTDGSGHVQAGTCSGGGGGGTSTSSVQSIILPLLANGTVAGVNATSSTVGFLAQGKGTLNPFQVNSSSSSPYLSVLANGNVGIGTSTPVQPLSVIGNIQDNGQLILTNATGASSGGADPVLWRTTATGSHDLSISNTGSTLDESVLIFPSGTSTSSKLSLYNGSDILNSSAMYDRAWGNTAYIGSLLVNGIGTPISHIVFGNSTSSYSSLSDYTWQFAGAPEAVLTPKTFLIGTSTPITSSLFVEGTSTNSTLILASSSGASLFSVLPGGEVNIANGVLGGTSATDNFLNVTGTLNATNTAASYGSNIIVTSAGNSSQPQAALDIQLNAGYTGSSNTYGINIVNSASGTGVSAWTGGASNYSLNALTNVSTTGNNVGFRGSARNSSSLNLGVFGQATQAANSPALSVGTAGLALNAITNVGGFFGLQSTAPTFSTSSALVVDNTGLTSSDLFVAQSNGVPLDVIRGNGNVGIGTSTPTNALTVVGSIQQTAATSSYAAFDATGKLIATTTPSGGSGTPGGSDTNVQFNNSGSFDGSSNFTFQDLVQDSTLSLGLGTSNTTADILGPNGGNLQFDPPGNYITLGGLDFDMGAVLDTNAYTWMDPDGSGTFFTAPVIFYDSVHDHVATLTPTSLTANRIYSLPDASGTLTLGTGTNGFDSRWSATSTLAVSKLIDNGTVLGVNASSSSYTFNLQGNSGTPAFNVASSSGASLLNLDNSGNLTLGSGSLNLQSQINFNSSVYTQFQATQPNINLDFKTVAGTGDIVFTPNAIDTLDVTHNQRVGINTDTPNSTLVIQGAGTNNLLTIASSTGQNIFQVLNSTQSVLSVGTSSTASNLIVQGDSSFPTEPLFVLSSSTGATLFSIDAKGHRITGGTSPSCGTGCASVAGDDTNMRMVVSTSISAATVNFANAFPNSPICIANEESGGTTGADASSTPTTVTVDLTAALTTKNIAIHCESSANISN